MSWLDEFVLMGHVLPVSSWSGSSGFEPLSCLDEAGARSAPPCRGARGGRIAVLACGGVVRRRFARVGEVALRSSSGVLGDRRPGWGSRGSPSGSGEPP